MTEPNLSQSEALRAYHDLVTTYLRRQDQGVERLEGKFDKVMEEVRNANASVLARVGRVESKIESNDTRDLTERLNRAEGEVKTLQAEVKNLQDRPAESRSWIGIAISVLSLLMTLSITLLRIH